MSKTTKILNKAGLLGRYTNQTPRQGLMPKKKVKAIPVTGRGDALGCETSMLPHFLDSRLTDGGAVVSHTRWSPFTSQED
jgi:hypothetical protein